MWWGRVLFFSFLSCKDPKNIIQLLFANFSMHKMKKNLENPVSPLKDWNWLQDTVGCYNQSQATAEAFLWAHLTYRQIMLRQCIGVYHPCMCQLKRFDLIWIVTGSVAPCIPPFTVRGQVKVKFGLFTENLFVYFLGSQFKKWKLFIISAVLVQTNGV